MARPFTFAGLLAAALALAVSFLGCGGTGAVAAASDAAQSNSSTDSFIDGSGLPACQWPASLNDASPGACTVGRAYVECSYPEGLTCEGGVGASGGGSSGGGVTQLCISDDPTSCSGCSSTNGAATCTNKCAPNQYAVSCGGPPPAPTAGGSVPDFTYQQAPAGCVGVGATPGGNEYSCCPCE